MDSFVMRGVRLARRGSRLYVASAYLVFLLIVGLSYLLGRLSQAGFGIPYGYAVSLGIIVACMVANSMFVALYRKRSLSRTI
jgi:predicted tellurium resistance membrane protein TerC